MLERPDIGNESIIQALEIAYPMVVRELHFLPMGLDPAASVFRVELADGRAVLLKLKTRPFTSASLQVPFWLHAQGLHNVVAPLQTREKELSLSMGSQCFAALYPWIEGQTAFEEGLDEGQSSQLGDWLRQMHTAPLPVDILRLMTQETFRSPHVEPLRTLGRSIAVQGCDTTTHKELVRFWNRKATQIVDLLARCEAVGRIAQAQNAPQTLCHADIHLDNVLVDNTGEPHVIDWDEVCQAPIERDLMFLLRGGVFPSYESQLDEVAFQCGYGDVQQNPWLIAWYRYAWVIQELTEFGRQVIEAADPRSETAVDGLRRFQALFDAGDVIDQAKHSDPASS